MMPDLQNNWLRRGLPLLLLPFLAVACDDSPTDTDAPTGPAQLSVHLTDAAGDVDSVWVQVDDVMLVGESGQTSLLDESTGLINLVELQDSATALAENVEVEPGTYGQLRFVLGGAVLETEGGDVYVQGDVEHPHGAEGTGQLHCPSCAQSGLKLSFRGGLTLAEGEDRDVLLDFDVKQSFGHQAGKSGRWIMHPVIHVKVEDDGDDEVEAAGEIEGTLTLATDETDEPLTIPRCGGEDRTLEAFVPVAIATSITDDEGDMVRFTGEADEEGEFEIEVLEEDTYDLGFEAETVFDTEKLVWTVDPIEPAQATIDAETDEVEGVSYTITGVTCEPVS